MMDGDLLLIFGGIAVMLMVIGISVTAITDTVLSHRRKMRELDQEASGTHDANLAERTELIEARLMVLERIATDRGTLLADEIEALRQDARAPHKLEQPVS